MSCIQESIQIQKFQRKTKGWENKEEERKIGICYDSKDGEISGDEEEVKDCSWQKKHNQHVTCVLTIQKRT